MQPYTVLIPARLASSRLPNKPLADLGGVPMVVRVAQRVASGVPSDTKIVVAADHPSIMDVCARYAVQAVLTRADHVCGSDRLAEASQVLGLSMDDIVVNVQGDEPLIEPTLIRDVAQTLSDHPAANMSTAAHPIADASALQDPNTVKVVTDCHGFALYFSRAPIPWWRDGWMNADAPHDRGLPAVAPLRHIGIYAYRVGFLQAFPKLTPAPMENTESLEQLRALWHGHRIAVHISAHAPAPGVDTPADLKKVRALFLKTE